MPKAFVKLLAFGFLLTAVINALANEINENDELEAAPWHEVEMQLPAFPAPENLLSFTVSAASGNRFMIDSASLAVTSDGVVRYTLVVASPSGAQNVSYEGIRCAAGERRLYAFGHVDRTWSKARDKQWTKIENSTLNRQHAALYYEYFCPNGNIVHDAEEARQALRAGGHPTLRP